MGVHCVKGLQKPLSEASGEAVTYVSPFLNGWHACVMAAVLFRATCGCALSWRRLRVRLRRVVPGVRTQVVILSQVLACDATLGYEDLFNTQVLKFNGAPLLCLSLNEALGSYSVPLEGFPEQNTLLMLLNSFFSW